LAAAKSTDVPHNRNDLVFIIVWMVLVTGDFLLSQPGRVVRAGKDSNVTGTQNREGGCERGRVKK
jgi:hypothetical protein